MEMTDENMILELTNFSVGQDITFGELDLAKVSQENSQTEPIIEEIDEETT